MGLFRKIAWLLLLVLTMAGCRELPVYFQGSEPLARVGGKTLYVHEVERIAPGQMSSEDSAAFYRLYIDRWVSRQLKLQEADKLFSESEADIEKLVEEYRQSLLIRKLDQYYIDRDIDTLFSDEAIQGYYNAHLGDFRTDRTLVKGSVLRFPLKDRRAKELKKLMESARPADRKDLEDICAKQGYALRDFGEWVDYEEFLSALPTLRGDDYSSLLGNSQLQQMEDRHHQYYFQLKAVRRSGEALPLEFVSETIRRILFNQRQSELLRQRDEERLREALEAEELRLYYAEQEAEEVNQGDK